MAEKMTPHQSNLRKGRFCEIGRVYSLTKRARPHISLTRDTLNARSLIDTLFWMDAHDRICLGAFVVMPDHYHIVFKLKEDGLPQIMKSIGSYSAKKIHENLGVEGNVWQKGYWDRGVRKEEDLRELFDYIHNNPVRKGLVGRAEEWPFSSLNDEYYGRIRWELFL